MSRIRLQLDEDCQASALASALQQYGIDAITANQCGMTGVDDETQLRAALAAGRVLLSNNIRDFVPLHNRWITEQRSHAGIIVFRQQALSVGQTVRRLMRLIAAVEAEEMYGRLEWLNTWREDKQ